jgi:hypothetical protein
MLQAEPTQEELQRQRVVSSQDSLDTVIEASVPVEPVGIDDQMHKHNKMVIGKQVLISKQIN